MFPNFYLLDAISLQEEEEARKAEYERQRQIREAEMQDRMLAEEVGTSRRRAVVR